MLDIAWQSIYAVWYRSLYVYRRTFLMNLVPNFFDPVIYLFGLGYGLGHLVGGVGMAQTSYIEFLAPGLAMANAMNGSVFETTYNLFVKMHYNATYDTIITTPVSFAEAMLGEVLWAMTRGMLYGFVFTLVNVGLGLFPLVYCLALLPTLFLTALMFASIGLCFTAAIRVIDMFSFFYTLFVTPMFIGSGIFYPIDAQAPQWMQWLSFCSPLFHSVRLSRATLHWVQHGSSHLPLTQVALSMALMLALSGLTLSLGITWFKARTIR